MFFGCKNTNSFWIDQALSHFFRKNRIFLFCFFLSYLYLCPQIIELTGMSLNLNRNLRMYHSIKEVAEMFGVNESTLRYWETEFPYLKPKTGGAGKIRQYSDKDIEQVRLIHNLVKVRGFKIAAARKIIGNNRDGADRRADVLSRLISVREELQALKKQMDSLQ